MSHEFEQHANNVLINWPDQIRSKHPVYPSVISFSFSNEDTEELITLQEAKDWCAIDGCDHDKKVMMLLKAARKKVENLKRISLINRTVTATIKPNTNLPFGPVKSITSAVDQHGNTYADYINPYTLHTLSPSSDIEYTLVYEAGPGETLSDDLKIEVLQQLAYMLENRGDNGTGGISPMLKR